MLKIQIPKDKDKIKDQILALKLQIEHDTNEKDKEIHKQGLKDLQEALEK